MASSPTSPCRGSLGQVTLRHVPKEVLPKEVQAARAARAEFAKIDEANRAGWAAKGGGSRPVRRSRTSFFVAGSVAALERRASGARLRHSSEVNTSSTRRGPRASDKPASSTRCKSSGAHICSSRKLTAELRHLTKAKDTRLGVPRAFCASGAPVMRPMPSPRGRQRDSEPREAGASNSGELQRDGGSGVSGAECTVEHVEAAFEEKSQTEVSMNTESHPEHPVTASTACLVRGQLPLDSPRKGALSACFLAEEDTPVFVEQACEPVSREATSALGADGVGCSFEGDLIDIVACRPLEETENFVWAEVPDATIAVYVDRLLSDFDQLSIKCDDMFQWALQEIEPELLDDEATLRIPLSQLHQATQMLINNLGCRDAEVLDRISTAFRLVSSGHGAIGLTIVEFRGYVASVLTQIHRELEWRQQIQPDAEFAVSADRGVEADHGPSTLDTLRSAFSRLTSGYASLFADPVDTSSATGHQTLPASGADPESQNLRC